MPHDDELLFMPPEREVTGSNPVGRVPENPLETAGFRILGAR
jgi:hypothetical protein